MEEKEPLFDLCGLWEMPSGKGWSGSLGGLRVLAFRNENKKNPKEPDIRLLVTKNKPRTALAPTEAGSNNKGEW